GGSAGRLLDADGQVGLGGAGGRGLDVQAAGPVGGPVGDGQVRVGRVAGVDADDVVGVVPLRRDEARVADEAAEDGLVEAVRRPRAGDDVLLHHHAAHVVGA